MSPDTGWRATCIKMKVHVGTSGYSYSWNLGRSLKWYIEKGFKTVEINSTFYGFPSNNMIMKWSSVPEKFIFSVKVNRSISHFSKLKNVDLWERFVNLFASMNSKIRFWLIQMPPGYKASDSNIGSVTSFIRAAGDERVVIEFRDKSWWAVSDRIIDAGAVFCSVDAPGLPDRILNSHGTAYVRLHGRTSWYSYNYSHEELDIMASRLMQSNAESAFIYFNNDIGMLENALYLLNKFNEL
ncbi:MAG: DUF72 domain-containing protein [Nitrososphaerota archaeon]|nr:DUF72 domain-containing protein [Nitrososphaerota archaeon]